MWNSLNASAAKGAIITTKVRNHSNMDRRMRYLTKWMWCNSAAN